MLEGKQILFVQYSKQNRFLTTMTRLANNQIEDAKQTLNFISEIIALGADINSQDICGDTVRFLLNISKN